jgi:hypothetical protein
LEDDGSFVELTADTKNSGNDWKEKRL